nr:uncharacterized protein [Tanacetum cinerariifolium]
MSTRSSARNLFPPLDNLELTIRRRSRVDPTLLNDFEMATDENGDLPVPNLRTMEELCQPTLNGRGGPIVPIAIHAMNFRLKKDMIQKVQNSCQFHGLAGDDANKHLDKFLHVIQSIKVNGVTDDAIRLHPKECYELIENMTPHHNDWDSSVQRSWSSSSITSSSDPKIVALKAKMAKINKNLMDQMLERLAENEYYFFLDEGIVLGHKNSKNGIEVVKAKIDVITKLPHPSTVKGIRSFLGHAGFYRRFIQDFSKIARPMTRLLEKDIPFFFSNECIKAFQILKKLTEAPILVAHDSNLSFELMCDASDFAIGAVLEQRKSKHFQPIHYASKTITDAQAHYTTTEKELLAVVKSLIFLRLPTMDPPGTSRPELHRQKDFRRLGHQFHGPFPSSRGNKYILMFVDYLSKWVEAKTLHTNDARVVRKILKSLFARFGTPHAIIIDRGTHFCNDQFAKVMLKYGVTQCLVTAYHPQTCGQVDVSNRGLKRILERTVGENHASWSDKLDDAL